jgi:hypothetical protein
MPVLAGRPGPGGGQGPPAGLALPPGPARGRLASESTDFEDIQAAVRHCLPVRFDELQRHVCPCEKKAAGKKMSLSNNLNTFISTISIT